MTKNLLIQKYGGTSVGTIDRVKHVAAHIAHSVKKGDQVVAVISAMGHQTDELLAMAKSVSHDPPRRELDMLLSAGERIAMALVAIALNDLKQHAVSLTGSQCGIITDTVHGNARISKVGAHRIQHHLDCGQIVIVAGFQGVSAESKEITTLGRGGSDLSAIALAAALGARRCQLYKDVDGVLSADPRVVKDASLLSKIPWAAMTEMAWAGASVLHQRGAHLAGKYSIPLEIRSSFNLERPGTLVEGDVKMEELVVYSINHKSAMTMLQGKIPLESSGKLEDLRSWLWQHGETPTVQSSARTAGASSGVDICWAVPRALTLESLDLLQLSPAARKNIETKNCGLISVIGSGFWQSPETLAVIRKSLQTLLGEPIFFDVKNNVVTIAVDEAQLPECMNMLHRELKKN